VVDRPTNDGGAIDALTGLLSATGFALMVEHECKRADRRGQTLTLLYIGIDDMDGIDHRFGSLEGERAVMAVAEGMRAAFRASDIVGRVTTDGFAVVPVDTDAAYFDSAIARVRRNLPVLQDLASEQYQVTVSFGSARYDPLHPEPLTAVLERAAASRPAPAKFHSVP
jgi:diguanylate cyclase (GGDEF)-like protein